MVCSLKGELATGLNKHLALTELTALLFFVCLFFCQNSQTSALNGHTVLK